MAGKFTGRVARRCGASWAELSCETAAIRVLDATADDQLRALGLDVERYRERLRRCVRLAAAVHDLGKANDHFRKTNKTGHLSSAQ